MHRLKKKIYLFLSLWLFVVPAYADPLDSIIKEQERLKQERLKQERLEQERLDQERLEQRMREQERLDQERLDQERLEQRMREQERLDQERLDQERLDQERLEQVGLEQVRQAEQFIGLNWASASLISRVTNLIADRCNDMASHYLPSCLWEKENELWVEGLYDHLDQKRIEDLQGFKASSGGVFVGYDRNLSEIFPNLRVGAAGGYLHTCLNWLESFASSQIHHTFLGLYAAYCKDSFNVNTSLLGAWQNYCNERIFSASAPRTTAKSQYNGTSAVFHAGGRYTFFLQQDIELIPFGSMDWIYISQEGFNELNVGSFNLHVQKNGELFLRSEWGVAVSRPLCCRWGTFVPKANVSWLFLTPISGDRIRANLVGSTDSSSVQTTNQWVNQFAAGLELLLWMNNDLSFGGIYKGIFGSPISEQEVRATAFWKF